MLEEPWLSDVILTIRDEYIPFLWGYPVRLFELEEGCRVRGIAFTFSGFRAAVSRTGLIACTCRCRLSIW